MWEICGEKKSKTSHAAVLNFDSTTPLVVRFCEIHPGKKCEK